MSITLHRGDLPVGVSLGPVVAVDTETQGLRLKRDRLCLVQLSSGDGSVHLVQIRRGDKASNLASVLADETVLKLFHYARFDMAMLYANLQVMPAPVYCTKIASRLVRTYTDRHGLKDLCRELLGLDLSKQQQTSDWAAEELSEAQLAYAAADVRHLHQLRDKLDAMIAREGRGALAAACFAFLPTRVMLDLSGWEDEDIFAHS